MTSRVLVLGYGNPGRRDDGLGPALARAIAARGLPGVCVEIGYQLQVEDAARVAEHDVVVFADADRGCEAPFALTEVAPAETATFTTHSVTPGTVLALAHTHFDCRTTGLVLGIRGYEFDDFGEEMSAAARRNLAQAVDFLDRAIRERRLSTRSVTAGTLR